MDRATRDGCDCTRDHDPCRHIVVTGGPGAGKTAVLEIAQREFCRHVVVLPEAASIVYGGGFPRRPAGPTREAAQRAIYHVQRELERMVDEERVAAVALCDRGTVDGLAYWPRAPEDYWRDLGTTLEAELARYAAVIHLRTPVKGYNRANPLRIETVVEAQLIDDRIARAWAPHPHVHTVDSTRDFVAKAARAIEIIRAEVPACCCALPRAGGLSAAD
jgi:predicted ATPase